jgi:hypothetical protein
MTRTRAMLAPRPSTANPSTHHPRTPSPSTPGIASVASLRAHLQSAIELEHATLPPYLCALYSLDPIRNAAAAEVLCSVFVEEMLHLTLVANLLNAVGGRPRFDTPELLPGYPRYLPHGDRSFEMSLLPFGAEALEQFCGSSGRLRPVPPLKPIGTRRSGSSTTRSDAPSPISARSWARRTSSAVTRLGR